MINQLRLALNSVGALTKRLPVAITQVADAIYSPNVPERMKIGIATNELMLFASQFRRNAQLWNGSKIPISLITFILSASGTSKDRSADQARSCFLEGYLVINEYRKKLAKQAAIQAASKDGLENPTSYDTYKKFYVYPPELFTSMTNSAAFLDHTSELEQGKVGSAYIQSSEIATEISVNSDFTTTVKDLSELYDMGKKPGKPLKDRTKRTPSIESMPIVALFMSSVDQMVYDESVKRKFKIELSTKLSRRSTIVYTPEVIPIPSNITTIEGISAYKRKLEDASIANRAILLPVFKSIAESQLEKANTPITISSEVRDIYDIYQEYNFYASREIDPSLPISKISREHAHWRALKLATALALVSESDEITLDNYVEAINITELFSNDLATLEAELDKEKYELFVSYMHSITTTDKSHINLHQLRKLGYIPTIGSPEQKVKELIHLASAYDPNGIYTVCDKGICFEKIIPTERNGISYRSVSGSKEERAVQCAYGFEYSEINFEDLSTMLTGDYAYSPFQFKDGVRSKDNIISGCKWLCLDIDKSTMTDEETHFILQNFNHHIVRTSDKSNAFKFRVLLELDAYVDIPSNLWRPFVQSISKYLSLTPDILPKSQIFFSYKDREVLSVTDKKPIEVKEHLMIAYSLSESKLEAVDMTPTQKKAAISSLRNTLDYAYSCDEDGTGSVTLIRAAYHMKDLGLTQDQIIETLTDINEYWVSPMPEPRFTNTILSVVKRF